MKASPNSRMLRAPKHHAEVPPRINMSVISTDNGPYQCTVYAGVEPIIR
jgi:hypothetical protein